MTDVIGSLAAGVSQILVGQPFDTLKSFSQSNGLRNTQQIIKCTARASCSDLLAFLYRGSWFSAKNALVGNVIVFNTFHTFKDSNWSVAASGCAAGLATTPAAFLLDGPKVLNQVKTVKAPGIRTMIGRKGLWATGWRETIGLSAHFSGYFYAREDLGLPPLLSGGIAGLSNWTLSYPIDVVRTRQIAFDMPAWEAIQTINWRGAAAAFPACAMRAVAVNSSVFWTFETVRSLRG